MAARHTRAGASAWLPRYREDLGDLVRTRLRWCAMLSLLGVVITIVQITFGRPALGSVRLAATLAYTVVSLATLGLTYHRLMRGREIAIGLAYVIVIVVILTLNFNRLRLDGDAAGASYVTTSMGTTLLIPWGPIPQTVISVAVLAGYATVLWVGAAPVTASGLCLMVIAVVVSVAGAMLIDRYRATSFERTWQQEQLVSLGRELAREIEPQRVVAKVLEHGTRLMGADSASLTLYDGARRVFRVAGLAPSLTEGSGLSVGTEFPDDLPMARPIIEAGTFFELPKDDPESPLLAVLAAHGVLHILYLVMRYGGEVVGIISFMRKRPDAFGAGERLLGEGIADQAALALRTARLVADLQRANELKSEFVSTMSHELRTPLNVILGFAEMARDPVVGAIDRAECVERIETAGRDLLGLIESTLEIGKIEAGRDDVRLEAVAFAGFWAHLGEGCERMTRKGGVALEWRSTVPAVSVVTDPRKLTVVIRNLVGNALKFTERGGVRVDARLEGTRVVIRVADTGVGIRPEDHEAIFEMFRQGDGSDTRRYGGTGLGLYIVRRFVQQLGGTIDLESAPGRGSTFTVALPVAIEQAPTSRAA